MSINFANLKVVSLLIDGKLLVVLKIENTYIKKALLIAHPIINGFNISKL